MAVALTKAGRVVVLGASTLAGIMSGILADPEQHALPQLGELVGALILSPFLVTLMGPLVAPRGWEIPMLIFGLCFWPLYFWLSWLWVQRAALWAWIAAGVLTAMGFYGLMTRLAVVGSV